MSLTVEEILGLAGLEEMTLRAGACNLQRNVRWPYVAENEGLAQWVMGGELVFVTGINHPRDEANLLRLVHEGDASGESGDPFDESAIHAVLLQAVEQAAPEIILSDAPDDSGAVPETRHRIDKNGRGAARKRAKKLAGVKQRHARARAHDFDEQFAHGPYRCHAFNS